MPSSDFSCKVTKQSWESVEIICSPQTSSATSLLNKLDELTNNITNNPTNQALQHNEEYLPMNDQQKYSISDNGTKGKLLKDDKNVLPTSGNNNLVVPPNTIIKGMPTTKVSSHSAKWTSTNKKSLSNNWKSGAPTTYVEEDVEHHDDTTQYLLTVRERHSDILLHNTTGKMLSKTSHFSVSR